MTPPPLHPLLLVDAGNSSVKFAVIGRPGGAPRLLETVPTTRLTPTRVRTLLRHSKAHTLAAASVVPQVSRILRAARPDVILLGPSTPLSFRTAVDRRTVGADRLANMAQAAHRFGRHVIVADFGTAATFDLLDGRGRFAGGAIAPGLRTLAGSLRQTTAQLPMPALVAPPRRPGRNTAEALSLGVVAGYAGLVRALLTQLGTEGRTLVFTGGDAALVARLSGLRPLVDPRWTLRGVAVLAGAVKSTCEATRPR